MKSFLSSRLSSLTPYVPGEQPKQAVIVKLNTNESPFPPSKKAINFGKKALKTTRLYCDIECTALKKEFAKRYGVEENQLLFTNGSDEILYYAFNAFCDEKVGAVFPDITYGFYKVFANLNGIKYKEIPLKEDLSVDIKDYYSANATVFIANPNAPTGKYLSVSDIEKIVKENPNNVVVIDEAYIDFGGESAVKLIKEYNNLLVTQTFSKSRSMAGARLGVGIANQKLIENLKLIKFSTNPYNVNAVTQASGLGSLKDEKYFKNNCKTIIENREELISFLESLGFYCTKSCANFVFCKTDKISGEKLQGLLRERGILVRHFKLPRISEYLRITVGSKKQIKILEKNITEIMESIV